MTKIQELMLSVCFGGMMGFIVAEIGYFAYCLISHIRKKRGQHKDKKAAEQQSK